MILKAEGMCVLLVCACSDECVLGKGGIQGHTRVERVYKVYLHFNQNTPHQQHLKDNVDHYEIDVLECLYW